MAVLYKFIQNVEEEKTPPNSSHEASISQIPNETNTF